MTKRKKFLFEQTSYYNPKHHGDLENYFEEYDGQRAFPLFKGEKHFNMLWKQGYILPGLTIIRVMWNVGRGDEHFEILDKKTLEGIDANYHAGHQGKHPISILNKCPPYEVHRPFTKRLREYQKSKGIN